MEGPKAKLARAGVHLDDLTRMLNEWQAEHPIRMLWVSHESKAKQTLMVHTDANPPLSLSAVAGDFAHNIRSALDNAAMAIFVAGGGDPNSEAGKRVYFPVVAEGKNLDTELARLMPWGWPAAIASLRNVQPVSVARGTPDREWLWTATNANNGDKHVLLALSAVAMHRYTFRLLASPPDGYDVGVRWPLAPLPLEANTAVEILSVGTWEPGGGTPADIHLATDVELPEVELGFAFVGGRGTIRVGQMAGILRMAQDAIDAIEALELPPSLSGE